jgi:hypothetical protein
MEKKRHKITNWSVVHDPRGSGKEVIEGYAIDDPRFQDGEHIYTSVLMSPVTSDSKEAETEFSIYELLSPKA